MSKITKVTGTNTKYVAEESITVRVPMSAVNDVKKLVAKYKIADFNKWAENVSKEIKAIRIK